MTVTDSLELRALRATDDPRIGAGFLVERAAVLRRIGVADLVDADGSWHEDPSTLLVCALHQELGLVGGIRIVVATADRKLPLQRALERLHPEVDVMLDALPTRAELGGLWSAERYAGRGLGRLLVHAGVACARLRGLASLSCLASEHVAPACAEIGFTAVELGETTSLCYPRPPMRSYAMANPDLAALPSAEPIARDRLLALCARPQQLRHERPRASELHVRYDIHVPSR